MGVLLKSVDTFQFGLELGDGIGHITLKTCVRFSSEGNLKP
jgi:hypothetical protein